MTLATNGAIGNGMARKGKAQPKPPPAPAPRVDMSREARVERLLGLGMTREEVELQLAATADYTTPPLQLDKLGDVLAGMTRVLKADRLGLDAEEATIADGIASTTLCNEHVPNADATACARCGKPVADILLSGDDVVPLDVAVDDARIQACSPSVLDELADDARQSEKRFTDDEWADITTPEERDAPLCAVLTPDQLAAVLNANDKALGRAADDGPSYDYYGHLDPIWSMRLSILADEAGVDRGKYVETLIRRQWVARGKGA